MTRLELWVKDGPEPKCQGERDPGVAWTIGTRGRRRLCETRRSKHTPLETCGSRGVREQEGRRHDSVRLRAHEAGVAARGGGGVRAKAWGRRGRRAACSAEVVTLAAAGEDDR